MIAAMGGISGTVDRSGRRILVAYLLLLALVAVVAVVVLRAGADRSPAPPVGGVYRLDQAPPCLGAAGERLELEQSGQFVGLVGPGDAQGELRLRQGRLEGPVTCRDGHEARAAWLADGTTLSGPVDGGAVRATRVETAEAEAAGHRRGDAGGQGGRGGRRAARPAPGDGRGAGRHPARADAAGHRGP
jgi:hypothetical protein